MSDERTEYRIQLLKEGERVLRRLAHVAGMSPSLADVAVHSLRGILLEKLRTVDRLDVPMEYVAAIVLNREYEEFEKRLREINSRKVVQLPKIPRLSHAEILARIAEGLSVLQQSECKVLELLDAGFTTREVALTLDLQEAEVIEKAKSGHGKIRDIFCRPA